MIAVLLSSVRFSLLIPFGRPHSCTVDAVIHYLDGMQYLTLKLMSCTEQLDAAKKVKERQDHLEMSKLENERSLLELRQRHDELR